MEYWELYAKRIRKLCEKRKLSINKLAGMSGLNQSTIDNIMRGVSKSPGAITLHKIANALNMTLSEFTDFKELNEFSFDDTCDENEEEK